jgi:uncharacterized membrane protein
MATIQFVYLYLLTIPVFFLVDMLWLGLVAPKFYQSQIGFLLGPINWTAAILFYLLYIVGIIIFAVYPALLEGSLGKAILLGALFGFFAYATYDLTNLATLKDWPVLVVVVDIVWGTILTGTVAAGSYLIGKALFF